MDINQANYSQIVINTINEIFNSLFSSIDNTIYSLLDKMVFIDSSIVRNSFFDKMLNFSSNISLITLANSLLIGIVLYYSVKLISAPYTSNHVEKPYQFLFKVLIFCICINFSKFLCEKIIEINSFISDSIIYIGSSTLHKPISFNNFIEQVNSNVVSVSSSYNVFSVNGLIKSFISVGLLNLLFSYSLRYILIEVFVLLSPFSFLSLISKSTSCFFKSWFRNFVSLLVAQSFIAFVFLIVFSLEAHADKLFSQLLYFSSIYVLCKSNQYIRSIIGGISTDVQTNFINMKSVLK